MNFLETPFGKYIGTKVESFMNSLETPFWHINRHWCGIFHEFSRNLLSTYKSTYMDVSSAHAIPLKYVFQNCNKILHQQHTKLTSTYNILSMLQCDTHNKTIWRCFLPTQRMSDSGLRAITRTCTKTKVRRPTNKQIYHKEQLLHHSILSHIDLRNLSCQILTSAITSQRKRQFCDK